MPKDTLTEKAIELFALYSTPSIVYKTMRGEYGESSLSINQVRTIREKYRTEILEKRKELAAKIPLLNVEDRWMYLQSIIDGALEGEVVYDKNGYPIEAKIDRQIALQALKLANDITSQQGVINNDDDEVIRSIVKEAFMEMKEASPKKPDADILKDILDELGAKARPYVEELKQEYVRVNSQES